MNRQPSVLQESSGSASFHELIESFTDSFPHIFQDINTISSADPLILLTDPKPVMISSPDIARGVAKFMISFNAFD